MKPAQGFAPIPSAAGRPAAGKVAAVFLLIAGLFSAEAAEAAKKKKPKPPEPRRVEVVKETVYVKVRERVPGPTVRGNPEALRPFVKAYGFQAGIYGAEVLGSNPFGLITTEWYVFPESPFFFNISLGAGTAQSSFSKSVVGADVLDPNFLGALEVLLARALAGDDAKKKGAAGGLYPYLLGGMTALYQGEAANVGAVLGLGNRFDMPFVKEKGRWALTFCIKDHIYSQKIRTTPSFTQNLVLTVGGQRYF